MIVTGFDDRNGCGYVLSSGADAAGSVPGAHAVRHDGVQVMATPELAAALRDALLYRPVARLMLGGPEVPLTLDDRVLLGWLRHTIGGVLTVKGEPGTGSRTPLRG